MKNSDQYMFKYCSSKKEVGATPSSHGKKKGRKHKDAKNTDEFTNLSS